MTRLFDLLYYQLEKYPLEKSLNGRDASGNWKSYSSQYVKDAAEKASSGLLSLGLKPGDKVGMVVYKNRPEWVIMDFAIQMAGLISIPLYPTISVGEYEYILNEAEVKVAFCGGGDLYDKLSATQQNVSTLKNIYTFDQQKDRLYWEDLFSTEHQNKVEEIKKDIKGAAFGNDYLYFRNYWKSERIMLSHDNVMHVVMKTSPHFGGICWG